MDDDKLANTFMVQKTLKKSEDHELLETTFKKRIKEIFETKVEGIKIKPSFRRILLGI